MTSTADRSTFLHSPSPPASGSPSPEPAPTAVPPAASLSPRHQHTSSVYTPVSSLLTTSATRDSTISTRPSPSQLLTSLQTNGYAVVPALLAPHALSTLRHAAARATAHARAGAWPHVRTLPKQFPPWPADVSKGIWGVQHLLHPGMPGRDAFLRAYFDPELLDTCAGLMGCRRGELVMELFNLLVRPDEDFELRWHRDSVPIEKLSRADEAKALGVRAGEKRALHHVQYNIPLYEDASLILVPGSHLRARSAEEEKMLQADPYAATDKVDGAVALRLMPGDCIFYDNNVLHRGAYDAKVERATLHGSVGDMRGGTARAQNVLQHAIGDWIQECTFESLGEPGAPARMTAENMKARLIDLGRKAGVNSTKGIHED